MMRITISSYFKVGFAIGTNDTVFTAPKLADFTLYKGAVLVQRHNKQLQNRLGDGITVNLSQTDIFKDWEAGAMRLVNDVSYHKDFGIDENLHNQISQLVDKGITTTCTLQVFSCGIAAIEVTITTDAEDCPEGFFRLAQMYEYSAYGTHSSDTKFHHNLRNEASRILDHFAADSTLKDLTALSFPQDEEEYSYNFFPSFTIIFHTTSSGTLNEMHKFRSAHDDDYVKTSLDGSCLYSSWYTFLIGNDGQDSTIEDLVRIYTLFYGASEVMENIMNDTIYDLLSPQTNGDKLSQLIKLQLTGNLIINNTNTHTLTQNEELITVFRTLNKNGSIELFHAAIERSLAVCSDIKNQFVHEREMKEAIEDKEREDKINFFVILFTSLTFISVACDFLNLDEMTSGVIGSVPLRIILYLAVMGAFVCIICKLFKSKK